MPRRKSAPDTRELILDTAQSLISENGYDGVAVSDICQKTGLPPTSIYYHFGSKMGILAALLDRNYDELHTIMPSPADFSGAPLERFERWFAAAHDALDQRPEYLRLLVAASIGVHNHSALVQETLQRIRESALAAWIDALEPIFSDSDDGAELARSLAFLGRSLSDGTSVAQSFEDATYASQVEPFTSLVRALAETRAVAQ